MINKSIVNNPRRRVKLNPDEIELLSTFVKDEVAPFATIYKNTKIRRVTVLETIKRGWLESDPALRMRQFLKNLKTEHHEL